MTLSGCYVDQHSVQVYSSAKPRIVTCKRTVKKKKIVKIFVSWVTLTTVSVLPSARELQSKEYYIWNSTGTAPVSSGQMMM